MTALVISALAAGEPSAVADTGKRVALIFDDGPRAGDARPLLELLAAERVNVSFALVGQLVEENPDVAREIAERGHEIVNHSQSHLHLDELDAAAVDREVSEANAAIRRATGSAPRWYWPPYLKVDDRLKAAIATAGLVLYEPRHLVDSLDWDRANSAENIYRRATTDVRDGSVILFHEWREETRQQLPAILAELRRQGCVFLTFSALRDVEPLPGERVSLNQDRPSQQGTPHP